jgi:hypothetical protein
MFHESWERMTILLLPNPGALLSSAFSATSKLSGYVFDHEHEAVFPFSRAPNETTPCISIYEVLPMQVSTY